MDACYYLNDLEVVGLKNNFYLSHHGHYFIEFLWQGISYQKYIAKSIGNFQVNQRYFGSLSDLLNFIWWKTD